MSTARGIWPARPRQLAACVEVIDHGVWRRPRKDPRERGRGILVMRELIESVHIDYGPGGTTVRLRLAVHDGVLDRAL